MGSLGTMTAMVEVMTLLVELNAGKTSPPKLLTEAQLISLMDKHGIGNIMSVDAKR